METKATAAVFTGAGKEFEIKDFPVTATPKGYGRASLIASGVCGTDLHIMRGTLGNPPDSIIGHEFVGRLDDADEAEAAKYGLKIGDAVTAYIAIPCGKCPLCLAGDGANCVNMGVTSAHPVTESPFLWGGYTEVNYTPLDNLIKIPDTLDPVAVASFACPGPTSMHAFKLAGRAGVDVTKFKVAVVQGLGPVGCYAALYLKKMGVGKVYAVINGAKEARTAKLRSLGLDGILSLSALGEDGIKAKLMEETDGLGVDLVVESSGGLGAVPFGFEILRNRGVYLIPGQYSSRGGVAINPEVITFKALHIIGSSQYDKDDIGAYIGFLEAHPEVLDVIRTLTTKYRVADANLAFADAMAGKNVKTVFTKE